MGKLRLSLFVVGLAACGSNNNNTVDAKVVVPDAAIDAKVFLDAPAPVVDLTCASNPAPTVANANVSVAGTLTEFGVDLSTFTPTFTMFAGATVDACTGNCNGGAKLATATTNAQGAYTDSPVATGGTPLSAYLKFTPTGDRTVFLYPAVPITKDVTGVQTFTFTPSIIGALALIPNNACNQQATNGMLGVVVTDCADTRITDGANIVVSVKQGGVAVGDAPINAGALSTMAAGLFLICNVPVNATTNVAASYKGTPLLAHDVGITAGTTTETLVRPGY